MRPQKCNTIWQLLRQHYTEGVSSQGVPTSKHTVTSSTEDLTQWPIILMPLILTNKLTNKNSDGLFSSLTLLVLTHLGDSNSIQHVQTCSTNHWGSLFRDSAWPEITHDNWAHWTKCSSSSRTTITSCVSMVLDTWTWTTSLGFLLHFFQNKTLDVSGTGSRQAGRCSWHPANSSKHGRKQ